MEILKKRYGQAPIYTAAFLLGLCALEAYSQGSKAQNVGVIMVGTIDSVSLRNKLRSERKIPNMTMSMAGYSLAKIARKAINAKEYLGSINGDTKGNYNNLHWTWQIVFDGLTRENYRVFPFSDTRICGTFKSNIKDLFANDYRKRVTTLKYLWGNKSYVDNTCKQGLVASVFTTQADKVLIDAAARLMRKFIQLQPSLKRHCGRSELLAMRFVSDFKGIHTSKIKRIGNKEVLFKSKDGHIYKGYWTALQGKIPNIKVLIACGNINKPSVQGIPRASKEKRSTYIPYSFDHVGMYTLDLKGNSIRILQSFTSVDGKYKKDIE